MTPEKPTPTEVDPTDLEPTEESVAGREDVPEADAAEQAAPVAPRGGGLPTTVGDLPEADAIEQALDAGSEEEERN